MGEEEGEGGEDESDGVHCGYRESLGWERWVEAMLRIELVL